MKQIYLYIDHLLKSKIKFEKVMLSGTDCWNNAVPVEENFPVFAKVSCFCYAKVIGKYIENNSIVQFILSILRSTHMSKQFFG